MLEELSDLKNGSLSRGFPVVNIIRRLEYSIDMLSVIRWAKSPFNDNNFRGYEKAARTQR